MDHKIDKVDQRLDEMDCKFDKIDQRFTEMDCKFDKIDQRFTVVDHKFDKMDQRLNGMDLRFDKVDNQINHIGQKLTEVQLTLENDVNKKISIIAEGHLDLSRKLDDALTFGKENEIMLLRVTTLENDMRRVKAKTG